MDGNLTELSDEAVQPAPGGLVYWALVLMGLAVFAPAILLPEWRAYEDLLVREQMERERFELLKSAVDREQRVIDGLRNDPAVIARVAQRELGFRRTDDQIVAIQPSNPQTVTMLTARQGVVIDPYAPHDVDEGFPGDEDEAYRRDHAVVAEIPSLVAPIVRLLPPLPYDFLFCDERTRLIMMCLGMSAIGAAVLLFGRRPFPVSNA